MKYILHATKLTTLWSPEGCRHLQTKMCSRNSYLFVACTLAHHANITHVSIRPVRYQNRKKGLAIGHQIPKKNNRVLTPCKHSRNRSARGCEWISYKMKMFRFGPARFPRLSCGPIFNHACTLLYSAYLLFPLVIQIWNMSKQRVQTALGIIKDLARSHDGICLARWRNHGDRDCLTRHLCPSQRQHFVHCEGAWIWCCRSNPAYRLGNHERSCWDTFCACVVFPFTTQGVFRWNKTKGNDKTDKTHKFRTYNFQSSKLWELQSAS